MQLLGVQVTKFKSVSTTTSFTVEDDVTALVGKNESGKTAVLQAMYRLNPLPSGHPATFDELRDYPRRYRSRDRATIGDTEPIAMTFEMSPEEVATIEASFGPGVVPSPQFRVARRYESKFWFFNNHLAIDVEKALSYAVSREGLDPAKYAGKTRDQVVAALGRDPSVEAAVALAATLGTRDVVAEIRRAVIGLLPKFQYFDEYSTLPGRVSIRRLQTVAEDDLEPGERTALALIRLAEVESEEFSEASYEPRKAALEAAANQLTDELFDYWTQNQELSVELDIEFVPDASGVPEPFLQIRVRNARHRVTLNMAERSKGFIWFFSFLAAFSEFRHETRRIILLDEPGLNLHAKAQADLLRYIDERLAPHHQVVYTTHSLFLIHPARLERCRTVEDLDEVGTAVTGDIWAARPDTVFPILGALGVDMTQTLIIGPDQLLVEGPADVVYLTVVSELLRSKKRTHMDPRWKPTPVGGADKVPTFIALLGGNSLNVAVLLDVAAGGNQRLDRFLERGLIENSKLLPLTRFTGAKEADIEDMFDEDWYLKLLAESGVGKFAKSKLRPGPRIVKRVEAELGSVYDHFQPAKVLLTPKGQPFVESISEAVLTRFEALFGELNKLLS